VVLVQPHDDGWETRAAALIERLSARLGPSALRIEHIGSTAIPGMAGKDVLDIQVSVADLDRAALEFDAPLRALRFQPLPYVRDHVPAGLDDDPARWAKRFWQRDGVNLLIRLAGSPNERLALLFRDWLRAHPEAVAAYGAFKSALAAVVPPMEYTEIKDPVVDLVIAAAEPWARATGWTP
jgi:GrpB-like predicted nucleotidyltransferase (UPF0157 family)